MSEFLCAWLPVFRLQAAAGCLPREPAIATERQGPLDLTVTANAAARRAGIRPGMTAAQALGRCPVLRRFGASGEAERALAQRLGDAADRVSPRVQIMDGDIVILDYAGLTGLHGPAENAAAWLEEEFTRDRLRLRTGIAAQPAAALVAAKSGQRRLPADGEAACLAPLSLTLLAGLDELTQPLATAEEMADALALFDRWGIRTLGALAALPAAALAARLGGLGTHLQRLARGEMAGLLNTPPEPTTTLTAEMQFDPPLVDLEVLKAMVTREIAAFIPALERRDRVVERTELDLVFDGKYPVQVYVHVFAVPTCVANTLAVQMQLELDRNPPPAPVGGFRLIAHVARPRPIQTRLFTAAPPDREKLPKLLGLLSEMFDTPDGRRVGSPRLLDTYRPQAFSMEPFAPPEECDDAPRPSGKTDAALALRVYRPPKPLALEDARIVRRAGPWRSLGGWWREPGDSSRWACDEWDAEVRMGDPPANRLFRLLHDTAAGRWYILGRYD